MRDDAGRALRVLCVTNMYPGPSAPDLGVFVRSMCDALRARGVDVAVAGVTTRRRGRVRTPAKYAALAGRAARRAPRADVLYAHGIFPAGTVAAGLGRLMGRPWVVTAHGQDVANLALRPVRAASAPALAGASAVVAVSGHLADRLRAGGLRLGPLHVLNMGVDLARFHPGDRAAARAATGLPATGPVILAVGSLIERKNPLGLLRAVALLRDREPAPVVAWVGAGPLRDAVAAEAARLGLGGRAILAGGVTPDRVPDWMRACDVLAVPSLVEPLGQVALEALACGRPVVATRVGGTAEVVPPEAGALVDPRDVGGLAAALDAVLASPPAQDRCRAAAERHGLDRQAAAVHELLRAAAHPSG